MTCAHPPGRVACPRCHEFRAVGGETVVVRVAFAVNSRGEIGVSPDALSPDGRDDDWARADLEWVGGVVHFGEFRVPVPPDDKR